MKILQSIGRAWVMLVPCVALVGAAWAADSSSAEHSKPSIDGTYQLAERVMRNGTVLRPPAVAGFYTMADGRFGFNYFIKKANGKIGSEGWIGRYTFNGAKYCEWMEYSTVNNMAKPGATNAIPQAKTHCTAVKVKDGRYRFTQPVQGVTVTFGPDGFTAGARGEFVDHWKKIG